MSTIRIQESHQALRAGPGGRWPVLRGPARCCRLWDRHAPGGEPHHHPPRCRL